MPADLVDEDGIRLAQDGELLGRDLTGAADRKTGAGKGMAPDEAVGQAQLAAERAHLVLEQRAQRLDQRQPHRFGKAAHIVMRLDRDRGPARDADRFDHIGVERALGQKPCAPRRGGVFLEDVDEQPPDRLALDLGVGHAGQRAQKKRAFIGMDQRDVVVVAEHGHDLLRLALAQKTVVDKDAGEPVPDRLVDQDGGHRAVHPARQAADHAARGADLVTDLRDSLCPVGAHGPVAAKAREAHEIGQKPAPLRRVVHLGVELHGIEPARGVGDDGKGRVGRGAIDRKTRRDARDMVAMRHPDLLAPFPKPAIKQVETRRRGADMGTTEFGGALAALDLSAQHLHHHLLAIADAQHRHAQREEARRRPRRAFLGHRGRAAREDDRPGGQRAEARLRDLLAGVDFAIDVQFAQAARDELRHLRAEVDDEEKVVAHHAGGLNPCPPPAQGARGGWRAGGCLPPAPPEDICGQKMGDWPGQGPHVAFACQSSQIRHGGGGCVL